MEFRSLREFEDYLIGVADDAFALLQAVKSQRDEQGRDRREWSEAEKTRIRALWEKVREHAEKLPECLAWLEAEIARLAKNMSAIQQGQGRLHNPAARGSLSPALERLQEDYDNAIRIHCALQKLIYCVTTVLDIAASKGFGEAEKIPRQANVVEMPVAPDSVHTPPPLSQDSEMINLRSLGRDG